MAMFHRTLLALQAVLPFELGRLLIIMLDRWVYEEVESHPYESSVKMI
jgi:hypothetical protein